MSRKTLEMIGAIFENKLLLDLKDKFKDSTVLHNINVYSTSLRKETQIDLILINPKGIFVIEAKNFTTSMKGSYNDSKWELRSRDKKVKIVFNSLNQNLIHIRALNSSLLKYFGKQPIHLFNLVCFPDGTFLNTDMQEVCNFSGLETKIREYIEKSEQDINVREYTVMIRKIDSHEIKRQIELYGIDDVRVTHLKPREE